MKINNNIPALQAYTNLLKAGRRTDAAVGKLSSGYRINSVADDAAGMAISRKLKNQIRGMEMAQRNTLDAISLAETADGAMTEMHNMLQRIRELAVSTANDTNQGEAYNPGEDPVPPGGVGSLDYETLESDRKKAQEEVRQLLEELNATAYKTEFNTIKMLAGHAESTVDGAWEFDGLKIQVGANKGQTITFDIPNISEMLDQIAAGVAVTPPGKNPDDYFYSDGTLRFPGYFNVPPKAGYPADPVEPGDAPADPWVKGGEQELYRVNLDSYDACQNTMKFCDQAIAAISEVRSGLGAYVNRLQSTERNLAVAGENTQTALSRIMDTDMALEMTENTQSQIISQAGMAILGQANQRPQQVIQLLQ